jgi:hypothetical protein
VEFLREALRSSTPPSVGVMILVAFMKNAKHRFFTVSVAQKFFFEPVFQIANYLRLNKRGVNHQGRFGSREPMTVAP